MADIGVPQIAPLNIEVFELSAGGVSEKRDDWTATVQSLVAKELARQTGYTPAPPPDSEAAAAVVDEVRAVSALMQQIALNHLVHLMAPGTLASGNKPLNHNVGRIDRILDALQVEGLLFVFVRDEYSTGGRKALMALGFLAGAATGIYVVPRGGFTINTAALVSRDGTVLWFNYAGSGGDMREPEGASATVKMLLAGLPPMQPKAAAVGE